MRKSLFLLVLTLAVSGWSAQLQLPAINAAQESQHFDGKWWSKTSSEERSGFINGVADCLTWTAHKKGFNATPEQLVDKITRFYEEHPESANLSVIEVWKKLGNKTPPSAASAQPGETWTNAHWYLDGFWWIEDSFEQKQGFVEGYLWCMRAQVTNPSETYSKPVRFYVERIDAFTRANGESKANREKVALILRRYKDKKPAVTPK